MYETNLSKTRRHNQIKTKDVIFRTVTEMLRESSGENLTVRHIAERAKISIGTFYHYFSGKDELLAYYLHTVFDPDAVRSTLNFNGDIRRELAEVYRIYLGYFKEVGVCYISSFYNPENQYLNTRKRLGRNDVIQDQAALLVVELLTVARGNGYIKPDCDIAETTNDMCAITKGVVLDWCLNEGETDLVGFITKLIGIYTNSLVTEKYRSRFAAAE